MIRGWVLWNPRRRQARKLHPGGGVVAESPPRVDEPEKGDPALVQDEGAVKDAVRQVEAGAAAPEISVPTRRPKVWLALYVLAGAALAWAYPLIGSGLFHLPESLGEPARRVATVLFIAAVLRGGATVVEVTFAPNIKDGADRYTFLKVLDLLTWMGIVLAAATQLFDNWYGAATSLGLVSLVLGLALQTPLASFFAWIYILVRQPYRVGDRIQLGDATGDVIQVSYLDTTLWEFRGPYLSTDHPSGRIIKFPNANVLSQPVFNYTWSLFPYRWDEIKFHIAYESDLAFVGQTMQSVVEEELGEVMLERVGAYRRLLAQTPVDELTVNERPAVVFRVSDNTWLEAIVRYVVDPRQAGRIKTRLLQRLLEKMNAEPERVLFPKSNMR